MSLLHYTTRSQKTSLNLQVFGFIFIVIEADMQCFNLRNFFNLLLKTKAFVFFSFVTQANIL